MQPAFLIGLLAAILIGVLSISLGATLRHALDCPWWSFFTGLIIGALSKQSRHWTPDHAAPLWYPLDTSTAMHTVKSALLSSYPGGFPWRILHCDPDTGLLAACLDLAERLPASTVPLEPTPGKSTNHRCQHAADSMQWQVTPQPNSCSNRQQILLVADLHPHGAGTGLWLRWKFRAAKRPDRCNDAIERTTQRLKTALAEQCEPQLIIAKR